MRILQVTATYLPEVQFGGPPQAIHGLSSGLTRRGHAVRVLTMKSDAPRACHSLAMEGIEVQYLRWLGTAQWRMPYGLALLRAAVDWADVVHCYGLYNLLSPAAAWRAAQRQKPFVLEPLGMYVPRLRHQRWKRLYHRLFTQPMANNAARVIATSSIEREELKQLAPDKRLVVRANPFDFSAYRVLPPSDPIRARYQLAPAERVILFVGRISPVKNLEVLVEAFARANVPDTRLLLIGPQLEPAYTARLQRQIAGLPARERVTLGGALYGADKLALLATAELFVLPSVSENFGNAAAEAVAAGLPVLLTTTCGIAPLIDGRAGHAVEPTVAALTEGLCLMMNQTQRAQFTQQQAEVLAELSSDGPVQQMEQLYQQILLER